MTWRARRLWLFGFFAGGASGTCSGSGPGFNFNTRAPAGRGTEQDFTTADLGPQLERGLQQLQDLLPTILPILLAVAAVGLALGLVFWLVSVACRGAVIAGGRDVASGLETSMGSAWQAGVRAFGRLLLLDLLVLVVWLVVLGLVAWYVFSSVVGAGPAGVNWLQVALVGFGFLSILAILGSVAGIVVAYAQRAIVLDGAGPLQGLGTGWSLARRNVVSSLLTWVIGLAAGIGAAIAMVVLLIGLAIPAGLVALIGFVLRQAAGPSASVPVFVLDGLAVLAVFLIAFAAVNTFMWHYWTLAYLRLSQPVERA
jgi:hypothetical protein